MNTITIPLPEGWELAEPKPRIPKLNEVYLTFYKGGEVKEVGCQGNATKPHYILRKTWTPPASCPKGTKFSYREDDGWIIVHPSGAPNCALFLKAIEIYSDFTPPPYSPYVVD